MEFNCWADYMACKSDRKCGKIIEGNLFSHDNSLIWSKYVPLPITEIPSNSIWKINTHIKLNERKGVVGKDSDLCEIFDIMIYLWPDKYNQLFSFQT